AIDAFSRRMATLTLHTEAATAKRPRATVRDDQLVLSMGDELIPLTNDGTPDNRYHYPLTSPDDRRVFALRTERVDERELVLVESTPHEELQPRVQRHAYA